MPPEDEVAVADAEPTEAPDTEDTLPVPTDEAVPTPEQEQAEEADSGAQEGEDEAVPSDDPAQILKEMLDMAPKEVVEEAIRGKVEQPPDVSEERVQWEKEQAKEKRTQEWNATYGAYLQSTPQSIRPALEQQFQRQNELIRQAVDDVVEGNMKAEQVQLNTQVWLDQIISPVVQKAQQSAEAAAFLKAHNDMAEALEGDESYSDLSTEQRKAYREARDGYRTQDMVRAFLGGVKTAAPASLSKKLQAEAEKKAGLMEKAARFREVVGNGRPSTGGAKPKAKEPRTLEEIDEALRSGPTADIDKLLARRAALIDQ